MFEGELAHPLIITDAIVDWPAARKWSLRFFAEAYGTYVGVAPLNFGARAMPGKATTVKAFIEHLDEPYSALPGIWIGADRERGEGEALGWSFAWEPFQSDPTLMDDVSPFPAAVPNMVASLPNDLYEALQAIHGRRFREIYISRAGTTTPFHCDWHHTFGCLVQLDGRKTFVVKPPDGPARERGAIPQAPEPDVHPGTRDRRAYSSMLMPGEMLIIPPDWPHYARSEDHTVTFSHNFFNAANFAAFMRCVQADAGASAKKTRLFEEVRARLKPEQRGSSSS